MSYWAWRHEPLVGKGVTQSGLAANSEIVGNPTNGEWGVVFAAVDSLPRYPAQLYEAAAYLLIFITLLTVDRRYGKNTPHGLLTGIFSPAYLWRGSGWNTQSNMAALSWRDESLLTRRNRGTLHNHGSSIPCLCDVAAITVNQHGRESAFQQQYYLTCSIPRLRQAVFRKFLSQPGFHFLLVRGGDFERGMPRFIG